jgi:hypothetical protein
MITRIQIPYLDIQKDSLDENLHILSIHRQDNTYDKYCCTTTLNHNVITYVRNYTTGDPPQTFTQTYTQDLKALRANMYMLATHYRECLHTVERPVAASSAQDTDVSQAREPSTIIRIHALSMTQEQLNRNFPVTNAHSKCFVSRSTAPNSESILDNLIRCAAPQHAQHINKLHVAQDHVQLFTPSLSIRIPLKPHQRHEWMAAIEAEQPHFDHSLSRLRNTVSHRLQKQRDQNMLHTLRKYIVNYSDTDRCKCIYNNNKKIHISTTKHCHDDMCSHRRNIYMPLLSELSTYTHFVTRLHDYIPLCNCTYILKEMPVHVGEDKSQEFVQNFNDLSRIDAWDFVYAKYYALATEGAGVACFVGWATRQIHEICTKILNAQTNPHNLVIAGILLTHSLVQGSPHYQTLKTIYAECLEKHPHVDNSSLFKRRP